MDFSSLPLPKMAKAPDDPFKIFAGLPRLPGAPNDLWRGQADALRNWHDNREKRDVLLSLNTGAGKTIVGLLIAKSLVNEGLENVIYVCPTIDLVRQTVKEASAIGIAVTTRAEGSFDNDLFESGKTFCVTSYAALFNGHSALRRRYFPEAVIFDDAHVAEGTMRDAFTIRFARKGREQLFDGLVSLFRPVFRELNRERQLASASNMEQAAADQVMVPPESVWAISAQIENLFHLSRVNEDSDLKYAYEHLKDHLGRCAIFIRHGVIEVTPPFLPSLHLDIFDRRVRRIYMSATLSNKADIVRSFGRQPDVIIEPENDAGNGERLILFERELNTAQFNADFGKKLSEKHKVLVAVPSYHAAQAWKSLVEPAPKDRFSEELNRFRLAQRGAFVLVSRVDGIDLPHDTCRLMIIDGIPRGEGLLEKYQFEYLHMKNFASSRVANRLVQLFGRINRGRSDYGAFLIAGRELNSWLNNDRAVARLPKLLRNQILLGRTVQDAMGVKSLAAIEEILEKVLLLQPRDQGWLEYYSRFLEASDVPERSTERAMRAEERNFKAACAEAQYAKHVWEGDYHAAREVLDLQVADLARSDEKLAGWHNLWIGACLVYEGNREDAAFYYSRAKGQLGSNITVGLSVAAGESTESEQRQTSLVRKLGPMLKLGRESFEKQYARLQEDLAPLDGATSRRMEEATRILGEYLGFESSRPDNAEDTGPDVLWKDLDTSVALGLELKTDKSPDSAYSKDDVSQALDHWQWLSNLPATSPLGVVLVGPDYGVSPQANPSENLFSLKTGVLLELRDSLLSLIRDAYSQPPTERVRWLSAQTADGWGLESLSKRLAERKLLDM